MAELEFSLLVLSVLILFKVSHSTDKFQDLCPMNARFNLSEEIPDASGSIEKFGHVFPPESRWLEDGTTFGCICYEKPCLPLCCPFEMVLSNGVCIPFDNVTSFTFPPVYSHNLSIDGATVDAQYFHIVVSEPCGTRGAYLLEPEVDAADNYYLMKNGSIYLPEMLDGTMWNLDTYCFWRAQNSTVYVPSVCFPDYSSEEIRNTILNTGMMISIPFLLVTFIVYSILPEMKNIHGLTLRGYVGCLFVAYTGSVLVRAIDSISDLPCLIFAFIIHFSFLASFFWLNVMCFDIWWTFGGLRPLRGDLERRDGKKVFMYSSYALGCASLVTGTCIIMEFAPGIPDTFIRPEFGVESICWFKTDEATALYFYGPMGVTVIFNIFFFVSTAVKIIRHKKSTAHHLKRTNSTRHGDDQKQWFNLYLKLFIVMGINWSMEIISWLYKDLDDLWYMTDLGNALQGLIIFVLFICTRNVRQLLIKRFACRAPNSVSQESTKNANRSSNSLRPGTSRNSNVPIRREDHF